jgi:PAS domain S-box-containing protein
VKIRVSARSAAGPAGTLAFPWRALPPRPVDPRDQSRQVQEINALLERRVEERNQELLESELIFRTIVENAWDWERWDAPGGRIIHSSNSCERITGYAAAVFEQDPGMLGRIIHPEDRPRWKAHYAAVHPRPGTGAAPSGPACETDLRILRPDGEIRWIEHTCHPIFDSNGHYQGRRVKIRDITERKQADRERAHCAGLARFNRIQQAIIECNRVIIRARSEHGLLQEFCRIAMKVQGVHQAWVGLAEDDPGRSIRPAAFIGFQEGPWPRLSYANDGSGQTPAGIAIRSGTVCVQAHSPVLAEAGTGHPGSAIALPLLSGQHAFGALVLNSTMAEAFDEEPMQMLLELANNLSIGIINLRTRAERDHALRTAEAQAEQLRSLALELAQTEQRERGHLAQLLHDHLQQLLVGATFNLETLADQVRTVKGRKTLTALGATVQEAIRVARVLTVELSPPVVREKRLAACLEWLARHFQDNQGLRVVLDLEGEVELEPAPVRMFIFDAVRELLLNVVKHARVGEAGLALRVLEGGRIQVTVSDRGAGFDPAAMAAAAFPADGLGLFSLQQRLQFLKGSLEIASRPGDGSRLTMVVPIAGWPEDRKGGR